MAVPIVLDNSVVMSWCFRDEASDYGGCVLALLPRTSALVPSIWPYEVANVLQVSERRKRLSKRDSARFLSLLARLPISIDQRLDVDVTARLLALARDTGLSSYDAAYLDLAVRTRSPLATLDNKLASAARRVGVDILSV